MKIFRTAVPSQEETKARSKGKIALLKSLSAAVIVAVVSSGFPLAPANAADTYNGTTIDDGEIACGTSGTFTILNNVVTTSSGCAGAAVIPAGVTSISGMTFFFKVGLTSVTIPESVTLIGDMAFSFTNALASFTVDASNADYSSLDGVLFNKTKTSLIQYPGGHPATTYSIPASVASIGPDAFKGTVLISVIIPPSVTIIGDGAFGGSLLESVVFSGTSALATIGGFAFEGTPRLTSIEIPELVSSIGSSAFANSRLTSITVDGSNANYSTLDGVLFNKTKTSLIQYPIGKLATTYISMPESVTSIGASAFSNSSLTSVTISANVASIGEQAFYQATSLTSIMIPGNVTSIGANAFQLSGITSVIFSGSSTLATIGGYAFASSGLTSMTIPASVTTIGDFAFSSAAKSFYFLGNAPTTYANTFNVTGSDGKAYIKTGATGFATVGSTWNRLTVAVLDDGVRSCTTGTYDVSNFVATNGSSCAGAVVIADGVQAINNEAFTFNESLTSVTFPASVVSIGSNSFTYNSGLTSFSVDSANPNFSSEAGVLFNKNKSSLLLFPAARGNAPYTVPGSVVTIAARAFVSDRSLTSITIPENVESIDEYAFFGAEKLTSVTFSGTSKLASIGRLSFKQSNLESINIPASVTVIGAEAFALTPLRTITFDEGSPITTIESSTFEGVQSLTSITIPASVTSIKSYAFYGASKLANVVFLGNAPTPVGVEAFTEVAAGAKATISASATGFPAVGSAWYGLTVATASPPAVTPPAETPPAEVAPVVTTAPAVVAPVVTTTPAVVAPVVTTTPPIAMIVATKPVVNAAGTSVAIAREPSSIVATAVAIGVSKTKVMIALKVPKASKPANQVTKYVIQLKSAKGVIITKTISVKAGGTVKPTLTGKKKTSYSMTVTAVTKSGKKTTWKGPKVKTS